MLILYSLKLVWHKMCIFVVGIIVNWYTKGSKYSVPLHRLIIHDWVKFLPIEFPAYAENFCSGKKVLVGFWKNAWNIAWRHHYRNMDHHWQYHVPNYDHTNPMMPQEIQQLCHVIPIDATTEIVVDLIASYITGHFEWPKYQKGEKWWDKMLENLPKSLDYHPVTLVQLCTVYYSVGFPQPLNSLISSGRFSWNEAKFSVSQENKNVLDEAIKILGDLLQQTEEKALQPYNENFLRKINRYFIGEKISKETILRKFH